MGKSYEDYAGRERRQDGNADLRAEFDELGEKVGGSLKLIENEMNQLSELMRDYYRRGLGGRSSEILKLLREEQADDISPALLATLDEVMGRRI